MTGPYSRAPDYWRAGWTCPIPVQGKNSPPAGFTGAAGRTVGWPDLQAWLDGPEAGRNIAVRLVATVGIDVDAHDGKKGEATLAAAVNKLGPLPPTWSSTSRGPGQPSRIRFFRIPYDADLSGAEGRVRQAFGEHVDILHRGHRYAMVASSIHPDTGGVYRWYEPDGTESEQIPAMLALPELPEAWLEFLTTPTRAEQPPAPIQPTQEHVGPIPGGQRHDSLMRYACHLLEVAPRLTQHEYEVLCWRRWRDCEQPPAATYRWTWEEALENPVREVRTRYADARDDGSYIHIGGRELDAFLGEAAQPHDWLVPGLLERQDRLILTGPEGGGKSTLLRQAGVQLASGIHPFGGEEFEPLRVLNLDLENGRRQVHRSLHPMRIAAGRRYAGTMIVEVRTEGIDLLNREDGDWFLALVKEHRPDVLITGPAYKMAAGDPTEETPARIVASYFDRLRRDHHCAILLEAHIPHAPPGAKRRPTRPYGASLWMRWPEFGLYLDDTGALQHWRGPRDQRDWPAALKRGGAWPWTPITNPVEIRWARIVELCTDAGDQLSERDLAKILGVGAGTIHRDIDKHRAEWDRLASSQVNEEDS